MEPNGPVTSRLAGSSRIAGIAAIVSILFGLLLVVWGTFVGAATMTGGGVMAIGRGLMAGLIVAGIRLSQRHTATFPYGLYKVENLFAACAGVIVLVLGYELALISLHHLDGTFIFTKDPEYALPFFLVAALLGGVMGYAKRRVSRAEGCPSLAADATFSFADAGALVVIGVALALDIAGVPKVDAIAGLIVTGFLAVIGFRILQGALRVLLDASVSREVLDDVRRVAEADPAIRRVLGIDGRNSGSFVFLHLVVEPAVADLQTASAQARALQRRVKAAFPDVDSIGIEFTATTGRMLGAVPLESDGVTVARHFPTAPQVAILDLDPGGAPQVPELVAHPSATRESGAGVFLAVLLGRLDVDAVIVPEELDDDDARETLRAYAVDLEVRPSVQTLASATAELAAMASERAVIA